MPCHPAMPCLPKSSVAAASPPKLHNQHPLTEDSHPQALFFCCSPNSTNKLSTDPALLCCCLPRSLFAAGMMSATDDILLGRLTGAEVVRISCTAATTCLAAGLLSSRLDSRQQYLDRATLLVQYLAARYPSFVVAGAGESVVVQLLVHRVLQLFSGQRLLQQEQVNTAQQALEQFTDTYGPVQVWCLLHGMKS